MNNQTQEALKMAIGLCEKSIKGLEGDENSGLCSVNDEGIFGDALREYYKLLQACKEALAEAEKQEPYKYILDVARVQADGSVEWRPHTPNFPVGTKLYTHPATWQSIVTGKQIGRAHV